MINKSSLIRSILLIATYFAVGNASAGSISASLKLPLTYSQTGDMQIWVRAQSNDSFDRQQILLTITEAQAIPGALIEFTLNNLIDGEDYRLKYDCSRFSTPEPCMDIVASAYYKAVNQSVLREAQATLISGTLDTTDIQLPLMTGVTFSGQIRLPAPLVAPAGGLTFSFFVSPPDNPNIFPRMDGIMSEGESSGSYRVTLPDDATESWIIRYECSISFNPNGACNDFIFRGYYDSRSPDSTTDLLENAELLVGNQNRMNIDLTLLNSFFISGVLTAPIAPTGVDGVNVRVAANDLTNPRFFSSIVNIAQGATTVPFRIRVPRDSGVLWEVSYSCQRDDTPAECENYLSKAYFDSQTPITMSTPDRSKADQLVGGQSHENTNFSLLTGLMISGKLTLSQGVAPQGGIHFAVRAADATIGSVSSTSVVIPQGASEVRYTISVDPEPSTRWRLEFDCDQIKSPICQDIADSGFYDFATGITVSDQADATPIPSGQNYVGLDMEVESSAFPAAGVCFPIVASNGSVAVVCL